MKIFQILLIIDSILIVAAVMLQPQKQQDALSALSGGGSDLNSSKKSRGFESFMEKVTWILGAIFFVLSMILVHMSSH